MSRPSLSVRLAGSPRGALLLFIGYAMIFYGWYEGNVVWWVALGAVGAAGRTMRAVRQVRRYKAWLAEWRAMSGEDELRRPTKRRRRGWVFVIGSALLAMGIPFCLPSTAEPRDLGAVLTTLWCAAWLYLAFALVRGVLRRVVARRKAKAEVAQAKDEAAPVAWLMGRASSSPSRADAERDLPEYCARLINGSH
jgi:hypothetical protein